MGRVPAPYKPWHPSLKTVSGPAPLRLTLAVGVQHVLSPSIRRPIRVLEAPRRYLAVFAEQLPYLEMAPPLDCVLKVLSAALSRHFKHQ